MDTHSTKRIDVETGSLVMVKENRGWCRMAGLLAVLVLCTTGIVHFTMPRQMTNEEENTHVLRHTLRQISKSAKAAIHLEGEYNRSAYSDSVEWRDREGQAFNQGDLTLKDNGIAVLRSGLYFVYSQASFRINCYKSEEDTSERFVHLTHTIMRRSDAYGDVKALLNGVRSACKKVQAHWDNGERWFNAIYLGGVFNLHAGDQLSTVIQKDLLPEVESEDGKTFFGAFEL